MLEMGDDAAYALGVRVERTRLVLLGAAVLLVAAATAAAGPVAFVALTAPQLARRLTRSPGPNLLPSLCMGAALLIVADWASSGPSAPTSCRSAWSPACSAAATCCGCWSPSAGRGGYEDAAPPRHADRPRRAPTGRSVPQ